MNINEYIDAVKKELTNGQATEHSYRPAMKVLLEEYVSGNRSAVVNEPKHIACGAPDFIILRKGQPVGYVETKDIDTDLDKIEKTDQLRRYFNSLPNLILTDYFEFRLYRDGELVKTARVATKEGKKIQQASQQNLDELHDLLETFAGYNGLTITSTNQLAELMGKKAHLIEESTLDTILDLLERKKEQKNKKWIICAEEYDNCTENELLLQYESIREGLIHDLSPELFADLYAQTITYGLFAARLSTYNSEELTINSAGNLIPETNPVLRKLFKVIEDTEIKENIGWVIDELITVFKSCNIHDMLIEFNRDGGNKDPFMHFYETFLMEYNPELRKQKGVYYTPEPVVDFIVRSVDEILQTDFDLKDGIADSGRAFPQEGRESVHRVQVLDPATGTGTFLFNVVKQIHAKRKGQEGTWSEYVSAELLPRIHGFELLMAPYAMCHLKIGMFLRETGYKPSGNFRENRRLGVYLTNSLQDIKDEIPQVSAFLSNEFRAAKRVKTKTPLMVVLGNPPYSVSSSNKSKWILTMLDTYKKDLNERNIQPLGDDYIKFIRLGQEFISRNGTGILAFITNNSFIDGLIHRQMRKNLLESFDKIYILDLHGNSRKKEVCPDGSKDENVFDIQQGVSINIFVKTGKKQDDELGSVFHCEKMGLRKQKFKFLSTHSVKTVSWKRIKNKSPYYFFVPKIFRKKRKYEKGFKIDELFDNKIGGIQTGRDNLFIDCNKYQLERRIKILLGKEPLERWFIREYNIKDSSGYNMLKRMAEAHFSRERIARVSYRPFDERYIYYDKNLIKRSFYCVQRLMIPENVCLLTTRQLSTKTFRHAFVTDCMADMSALSTFTKEISYIFPLYFYPKSEDKKTTIIEEKSANFQPATAKKLAQALGLDSWYDLDPMEVFDYIYAVLHSPSYREEYEEFLKIDFPRIPYPESMEEFQTLAKKGAELRNLHLMKDEARIELITQYPVPGNHFVEKMVFKSDSKESNKGRVYINSQQYFSNVPRAAWEFYIGGYQPLQKYLKDRKNRELTLDEINHYQRIVTTIVETMRIMEEIDKFHSFWGEHV